MHIKVVNQKIFYNYKFARFVLISLPLLPKTKNIQGGCVFVILIKAVHSQNRHVFVRRSCVFVRRSCVFVRWSCVFVRRSCVFVRRRGAPFGPLIIFHGSVTCFHGKATCFHGEYACLYGEKATSDRITLIFEGEVWFPWNTNTFARRRVGPYGPP